MNSQQSPSVLTALSWLVLPIGAVPLIKAVNKATKK